MGRFEAIARARPARRISASRGPRADEPTNDEPPPRDPKSQWFWQHYDEAAGQVVEGFGSEGLALAGKVIADIGCGDGFIDLGVLHKANPARLVGFDVNKTNVEYLLRRAGEEGVLGDDRLDFVQSEPTRIPAEDGAFDFAFSWSAFEHIARPVEVLSEIRRILRPGGALFLQLWPFYFSARGSHLWEWFPDEHHHLQRAECEVVSDLNESDRKDREWTGVMSGEFQRLNRITVDELQRSILAAGFVVRRVELLTGATRLSPELGRYSWIDLTIGGVKLVATPN
jgi:ubiquinone/menaquinone biosynthesis C-methylase UbiE